MEPIDVSELGEILRTPEPAKPRSRKSKVLVRDYDTWFKKCIQHFGVCENPECSDPRPGKGKGRTMVTELPNGKKCCRYCFLDGYGDDSSDN